MLDTYPEEIQKTILNHTDISKLLSPYGMNYQTMNVVDRIKMNQTIQKNITAYQQKYPKPTIKPKKKSTSKLSCRPTPIDAHGMPCNERSLI